MSTRTQEILDFVLLGVAVPTGLVGMQELDLILAIVLKAVSIISFSLIIVINWNKIKGVFKK